MAWNSGGTRGAAPYETSISGAVSNRDVATGASRDGFTASPEMVISCGDACGETANQCCPAGIGPPAAGPSAGACGGLLDSDSSQSSGGFGDLPAMMSFSCSSSMVSYF